MDESGLFVRACELNYGCITEDDITQSRPKKPGFLTLSKAGNEVFLYIEADFCVQDCPVKIAR